MSTFLLEIGTEELPADFARLAPAQLERIVRRDLGEARLAHGPVWTSSTPRRLSVLVHDLVSAQPDLKEQRKGPPAEQAFRNGAPTPAALGFARRCGVGPESLEVRDTPRGAFVYATVVEQGRSSTAVLAELIPAWVSGLQGRRFMRWGGGENRFSRPVRWLVALLDSAVVPLQLEGCDPAIAAGRTSRGHRLLADAVPISDAASYVSTLAAAGVQVERQRRGAWIRQSLERAAEACQARPDLPTWLIEELTDLVESPVLIEGEVPEASLDLPPEVLCSVMRVHQRTVPLVQRSGVRDPLALHARGTLVPRFLCVGNGLPEASAIVRRGNERVLKARLADARFFLEADRAVPSIDRRDQLARVTFAEGLGSLRDRVERLEWCTDVLLEELGLEPPLADHARRAAHLCKHDLVSQMVGEFPELQGVMGAKYLLAEGEARPVALAVLEHYMPRGAGDALPGSPAGAVVALAERLELLLSIYAKGERPSGSSDPYALRRAGNGVIQILWHQGWSLDLPSVLARAASHWRQLFPHFCLRAELLADELLELLRQRVVSLLEEDGVDADLVQAVAGDSIAPERILRDPADARRRLELLVALRRTGALEALQTVVNRATRLAARAGLDGTVLRATEVVDPQLFEKDCESAMLAVLTRLEPIVAGQDSDRYEKLASGLAASAETLAAFFDGASSVMVMADDPDVRRNRLHLLAVLRNQASVLADFSCIGG